jgi:hypothetical protein
MNWAWWYTLWTTGSTTASITMGLDWQQGYLVTGGLTQTDGGDYAHVYIAEVCSYDGGDEVMCGIRDDDGVEPVSSASSVTVSLHTTGGSHRAEGIVYQV